MFTSLAFCLLVLLVVWHSQKRSASGAGDASQTAAAARPVRAAGVIPIKDQVSIASHEPTKLPAGLADVRLPKQEDLRWREPISEPVFDEFRRWTEESPAARAGAGLQQGIQLARQRRHELQLLIENNPQRALELAVPHAVRRQLPDEILALLEQRVDASGDLMAVATTLDDDRGCRIDRKVTLRNGQVFDAYTYGRRGAIPTRDNIAIHGVALDGKLALSDLPGRVLAPTEIASRLAAGIVMEEPAGLPGTGPPMDAGDEVVITLGATRMARYNDEIHAIAALLDAEGAEQSGDTAASAADLDGVIAYSPKTEGKKTLLIIRVDFPDYQGQRVSDSTLQSLISDMNSVYGDMSSGKASFALGGQGSAFTPTLRLPNSSSYYNQFGRILEAARAVAAAAGYDYTNYTYEVVVTGPQPVISGSAGVAFVGSRGAWLHNSQWNLKTCAHEVGHNFGLPHSGAWDPDNGSVIGPGQVWEYGNVFDMMGVGGAPHSNRHFSVSAKEYLDWLPTPDIVKITTNGSSTTRIRAMDKVQADGNKRALVVDRAASSDDYWIEYRQLYGTNYGMRDGVLVNWASINGGYQQPLLLDMRPDTSEKTDAVLPIGMTFSDTAAGVHITPVVRGTDPDGVNWIDVTVNRGNVSGNLPPVASLSATHSNPAVNGSVNFNCTAGDPNGDTLAYFWDWGNGTTTANNSPIASKSWPAAGIYIVQCTVSDMKGLTATADFVVQVGETSTFFIEGVVRSIQGNPLQGVVVSASSTQKATSDATGRYVITGLAAGNYTLSASAAFVPDGFTNPVTVGPSLQDRNFVRPSYPLTWDANAGSAGAQDGSGSWANAAGNWRNQTTGANNQNWNNSNLDAATFGAGTDGAYTVTLSGTVQAGDGITFANSGYTLSGAAGAELLLHDGANSTPVNVAAGKSATINSAITYQNNKPAAITVNSGAVLNLGGGATNSQYNFNGSGTVNMTAGAYNANVGSMAVATFNQSGGTFSITPGNNVGFNVSSNSRSVDFTLSGGTLTVNGNNTTSTVNNAYLGIGNGTAISNTSTLTVKSGATVNVGTTSSRSGEVRIANTPESNGTLDVQGGTLTIGTGNPANKIYFFKAGAFDAPYLARMTQSGGTVTANGIQFGSESGTYDAASSAVLQLSGGSLYVGAQGITRGSAGGGLAVAIRLQGGTLGADQNWSSSLDMQLGNAGGGVVIRAQDSGGTGRNIIFSGNLSDDGEVNGSLAKSGVADLILSGANNTYSGGTIINAGRLFISNAGALPPTGSVLVNGGTLDINASGSPAFNQSITLASGANLSMRQTATLTSVTLPVSGMVAFNSDDQSTVDFSLASSVVLAGDLTVKVGGGTGSPGAVTLAGAISGSGGLNKSQVGTLILCGANSYAGATIISEGTLRMAANNVIPDGSNKGSVTVSGTLDLNGFSETVNGLGGSGTVDNTAASTTAVLTVTTSSTFSGTLQNSGADLALVKTGNSDLVLSGSGNSYRGGTSINAGRLFISNAGALTPYGIVQVNSGGSLNLNASGSPTFSQSITLSPGAMLAMRKPATLGNVSLPASGSVIFNSDDQNTVDFSLGGTVVLTGDLTVQVGGAAGSPGAVILAGVVTGSGGLNKTQAGKLILTGSNNYTGSTTVSAGTLVLDGGGTDSPITVNSGAELGFILGSSVTSTSSLTLAAGHAITITGAPTLGSYTLFTTSGTITGTPALSAAIPDYELLVVGGNQLRLVQITGSPYDDWSGGSAFDADSNGDGVINGLAFLLGASDKDANALGLLPVASSSGANLVLTFSMRNATNRGSATLSIQHSRDLDMWTTVPVPDAVAGPTGGVTFNVIRGNPLNSVTATISSSETGGGGKLFGRLNATD